MDFNDLINSGFYNLPLLEEKYALFQKNPSALENSWRILFAQLDRAREEPVEKPTSSPLAETPSLSQPILPEGERGHSVLYYPKVEIAASHEEWRIQQLITAYRTYGHLIANINPIATHPIQEPFQLKLESSGFTKQDLSKDFPTCGLLEKETAPLLEIINALKSIYCDKIGFEYMGSQNSELEKWLQEHIENRKIRFNLDIHQKRLILQHLNKSELFESFIHTKYVGQKRFSLEGCETFIPMLASAIDLGALLGAEEYIIGMAHRGRLNVLANIFDKSYADIFSEFEEGYVPASVEGSGDVKYHKGFYSEVKTIHGHQIKLTLTPNPSHLESVDPVVEGQVRACQELRNDKNREHVIPILVHGDAALSGQGVVYETMQFSCLEGYSTGGTLHFVINNHIGFTTLPKDGRSTYYCTDIARTFNAPVFHVNAEDPEGCVYATNLAMELRQKFHCDVFVDLSCYRKYGHNETDEPAFTQPLEYQLIRKKKPIREIYRDALIHQGVLEKSLAENLENEFKEALHKAVKIKKPSSKESPEKKEAFGKNKENPFHHIQTGVPKQTLQDIGARIFHIPIELTIHPKLVVLIKERQSMLKGDGPRPIDWGMAELLAYGSILWNGTHIRLSGQDSCRGTFSHRHALLMDQTKEQAYIPLKHLKPNQGQFDVFNSPLSECAVLGFEFGYSTANHQTLVIWEAQFGDFSNSAQVIIDQYIATAEQKWMQKFSLTLFLPHGYEGQGPEHSSGRIERFLALAGNNNMLIANPTTPAQFFHLLRRQVLRSTLKPLVVFTPKSLLRHPACVSSLEDLSQGSFQEILEDPSPPQRTRRLVLCSGHIYYNLIEEREKNDARDMMIIRIEQLYPLDADRLKDIISKNSNLKECIWVQEEPSNMGAWNFIRPILRELLPKEIELTYIGRTRSASPAVGSFALHKKEYEAIMSTLFGSKEQSIFDLASRFKA